MSHLAIQNNIQTLQPKLVSSQAFYDGCEDTAFDYFVKSMAVFSNWYNYD